MGPLAHWLPRYTTYKILSAFFCIRACQVNANVNLDFSMGIEEDFCNTKQCLGTPSLSTVGQLFHANQKPRYASHGELNGDAQSSLLCFPSHFSLPANQMWKAMTASPHDSRKGFASLGWRQCSEMLETFKVQRIISTDKYNLELHCITLQCYSLTSLFYIYLV